MFSILLIIATCVGYYFLDRYYPRENKEKIYFAVFIGCWILIVYLLNFQQSFMYKIFKQIHDIDNRPLYDLSDFKKNESQDDFKLMLLNNQNSRCGKCMNYILPDSIPYTGLSYKTPLYNGGEISHDNLMVVCSSCQHSL